MIGNGAYSYDAAWELTNPPNDAQAFAQILEAQGADVLLLLDGDFEEMQSAVAQFSAMASGAEAAIFYYAGHGFQVARQNYILPTDFAVGTREETARTSMALSDVLAAMKDADGPKLVFLDACRNNPLDLEEDSSEEAGLARVDVEGLEELWIAYAAAENSVAMDGEEGGNSPFTEALLTHIGTPGLSVDDMIRRVRKDVISQQHIGGRQVPWNHSSLTERFDFVPGQSPLPVQSLLYKAAVVADSDALKMAYLQRYPDASLPGGGRAFTAGESAGRTSQDDGEALWQVVLRTRDRSLALAYLDLYPDGARAKDARRLLDVLPQRAGVDDMSRCARLATHPSDATDAYPGVPGKVLREHATEAIEVCRRADNAGSASARSRALLARAEFAAGAFAQAYKHFLEAEDLGSLRATISLAHLKLNGFSAGEFEIAQDVDGALARYEAATEQGSSDAAINLAIAMTDGTVWPKKPERAAALLRQASDWGDGRAMYNLGLLARRGTLKLEEAPHEWFQRAAQAGNVPGYYAAAVDLESTRTADAARVADLLLRAVAADGGEALDALTDPETRAFWRPQTMRAIQGRLAQAGLYSGAPDGLIGPGTKAALQAWRTGGFDASVLAH